MPQTHPGVSGACHSERSKESPGQRLMIALISQRCHSIPSPLISERWFCLMIALASQRCHSECNEESPGQHLKDQRFIPLTYPLQASTINPLKQSTMFEYIFYRKRCND